MFDDILGFNGCKDIDCGLSYCTSGHYTKECAVSHSGYNWMWWCMLLILSGKSVSPHPVHENRSFLFPEVSDHDIQSIPNQPLVKVRWHDS
jgi:hypothetical protein